eukprot:5574560-Alexandrium_andersonii.AAC.1
MERTPRPRERGERSRSQPKEPDAQRRRIDHSEAHRLDHSKDRMMDDLEARLGRMLGRTANTLTDEFRGVSRKVDDMGMRFT